VNKIAIAAEAIPHFVQHRSLRIVFASTSGHTEYVVEALIDSLKSIMPGWEIEETMAEKTQPQDLLRGDVLLLASATWNTGGIEGQLNPHMWGLLHDSAKTLDLAGKPCACIGLGDHRYFYTARAADHGDRWTIRLGISVDVRCRAWRVEFAPCRRTHASR
jgi:flavodoxin I